MKNPFTGSSDIDDFFQCRKFKKAFRAEHPEYFDPDGILLFCGPQGSGKTISAVSYVRNLAKRYPAMILVTNVEFHEDLGIKVFPYTGLYDLNKYENGYAGVVFFIDEIQIEFNSLESKKIDPVVITEIAQQRKQRKHIVGTSQVFNRIAKPFREQVKLVCMCRNLFGYFQINCVVKGEDCEIDENGHITTEHIKRFYWFHTPVLYSAYDTYAKIIRTSEGGFS